MIDRNFVTENLDPVMWNRLGAILNLLAPEPRVLHVLRTEKGFRTVMNQRLRVIAEAEAERAGGWEALFPEADEIRIYTCDTAEAFLSEIQQADVFDTDTQHYMKEVYRSLEERVEVHRVRKQRNVLWKLLEWWGRQDGICNLGITKDGALYFQCILEFRHGSLVRATTSDRYEKDVYNWEKICENVEREFPGNVRHFTCTLEELERKFAGKTA